jgi:cobalt-zinc-cadmium resistance protein CzcA
MLDSIIAWSLSHRLVVLAGAALVCLVGGVAVSKLVIDAFPDTTPVQVQINTVAPGMVAEEVERQITFPIELEMGGMPGLESIRSASMFGLSVVIVTFQDGTDIYFARQLINERIGGVAVPAGVSRPELGPVSTGLGEVLHYLLVPDGMSLTEVKTLQEWTLKPAMRSVPGVAEINAWGGLNKQYQIRVDPTLLKKYALTFDQVVEAVPRNNFNVGGGVIEQGGDALLVYGVGRTVNIAEIERIVIASNEGVPIRIRDVAEVVIGHEIRKGLVTANGRGEVVLGLGFMLMGENSYAVTSRLRDRLELLRPDLPAGVDVEVVYDRTRLIDQVIATVRQNLLEGAFLVVIILYCLLGNLRAGLVAATAIPLSMMCGFVGMWQTGIAASLLSLGAIDFGIVVDSSVVVIESILERIAHHPGLTGKERLALVEEATKAVKKPACFGQLIIMIVYIPILTLEGVEGKMFRPMALTVVFILVGSLVLSLTVVPVLSSLVLPRRIDSHDVLLVRLARAAYRPLLRGCLAARSLVAAAALVVLSLTLARALQLGTEFVPRLSEGDLVIGAIRASGTSLEESARINTLMERLLLERFPDEVENVWSRTGTPEVATDAGAAEATDMFISLRPRSEWTKAGTQAELVEVMSREIEGIPGQIVWFTQPIEQRINEMVSGVRADIAVKVFGDELSEITRKAEQVAAVIRDVPGGVDIAVEQVSGQPILRVAVRQDDIARYGISAQVVLDIIESLGGKAVGEIVEGQLRFPVVLRLPDELRGGVEVLGNIAVRGPAGETVPLSRICDIETISGPKFITREWSNRRVVVQCNVRGRDVGGFVAEAQRAIAEKVDLPPGRFRLEWGGQFENMQRAQKRLTIVVPLALLLIVALLFVTYRNAVDTALLFISVPFACVGGIWALALREMPLSISAAVGFITLSGVSVLNGMVLASALRERLAKGVTREAAVEETSVAVMRTIIMTALVASLGFIPMALSEGTGAEVQRPLATVVIGGVITSTLFTMFILPALYRMILPATPPVIVPAVGLAIVLWAGGGQAMAHEPTRVPLWPEGAPGARGQAEFDQPFLEVWPAEPSKASGAALVICPGGGYGGLATGHEGDEVARWCHDQGLAAFVLHYRLGSKGYHYPTQLHDVQRAVRVVRAGATEFGVDPQRIGIFGFSAGGHLASMAATLFDERPPGGTDDAVDAVSARPDLAVLAYPVISMSGPHTHAGSRRNLLGPDGDDQLAERLSTDGRVGNASPPTFIFQTDEDPAVTAENAVAFYLACRRHGVPAELHVYQRGRHGVGLAADDPVASTWTARLRDWLDAHGFLQRRP